MHKSVYLLMIIYKIHLNNNIIIYLKNLVKKLVGYIKFIRLISYSYCLRTNCKIPSFHRNYIFFIHSL